MNVSRFHIAALNLEITALSWLKKQKIESTILKKSSHLP